MVKHLGFKLVAGMMVSAFAICWGIATAHAGLVAGIEAAQSANPSLLHQWKFEGDSDATRLLDSGPGGLHLQKVAGPGGDGVNDPDGVPDSGDEVPWSYPAGDVDMIGFEPGLDGAGVSQAYRPQKLAAATSTIGAERVAQSRSGAGLYGDSFSTPSQMTIEAIVSPDKWEDTANAVSYIAQTRPGNDRGYFLAQSAPSASRDAEGNLVGIVGTNFANRPPMVENYREGHWYYVAVTFDMSSAPTAIANAYYRDLTTDGPLVHSLVDHAFSFDGSLTSNAGPLGIGLFAINNPVTSAQEFFNGSIDNLAIYSSVLPAALIELHSRGVVPEPASMLLLVLGGTAVACRRRRAA